MDIPFSSDYPRTDAANDAAPFSVARSVAPAGSASPNEISVDRSACRVLVVEDDPVVCETCVRLLSQAGYAVSSATDGEEGWAALRTGNFQLLLTDNRMPRLTGIDMVRRLRAAGFTLPVIFASGTLPWDLADIRMEFAPFVALEKPFGWDALQGAVRAALGSAAAMPLSASEVTADV